MAALQRDFESFKSLFNANDLANADAALVKLKVSATEIAHQKSLTTLVQVEFAKLGFLTPERLDSTHFLLASASSVVARAPR
jgi:hypothetical protein